MCSSDLVETSGTEIITVAIRRLNLDDPNEKTFLDHLDWEDRKSVV